jgi:uncharacterized membrane protein (UPF0127 family)
MTSNLFPGRPHAKAQRHQERKALLNLYIPLCVLRAFVSLCVFFSVLSCTPQKLAVQQISIERDGQEIALVMAEIARTQDERAKGLMFRKKLEDGKGMLFIFETDQILSFWMRNTYIPLSIAYITYDGRIVDIKDMYPHDEKSVNSSRSVRYALEVPQGWFSRSGVRQGDFVRLDQVAY